MHTITANEFYKQISDGDDQLPAGINKEIGHFNVFNLEELIPRFKDDPGHMPYNRRAYYKISLVRGKIELPFLLIPLALIYLKYPLG